MKGFFVYALEFMLSFDKMQNTRPVMFPKFDSRGKSILTVIQVFFYTLCIVLYIGCSGPVVEDLNKINMLQSLGQNTRYTEL